VCVASFKLKVSAAFAELQQQHAQQQRRARSAAIRFA
jgi:hypothetical protein